MITKSGQDYIDSIIKPKVTSIVDFFDPNELSHLSAYKNLCETGFWPENFVPENIEFPNAWYMHLDSKIAKHFVEEKLNLINNHLANVKVVTKQLNTEPLPKDVVQFLDNVRVVVRNYLDNNGNPNLTSLPREAASLKEKYVAE